MTTEHPLPDAAPGPATSEAPIPGATPERTARPGHAGADLPDWFRNLLQSPLLWISWGLAMAAMGVRLPEWSWPPDNGRLVGLSMCAVAAALLATPYTGRPVVVSARWHYNLIVHRNTMLSAGFVVLVATEPPRVWEAVVDAFLLAGYLLLLDAVTMPAAALRRIASPPALFGLAALVAAATALIALPGSASPGRKAVVAIAGAAVLAVAMAAGFLGGERRRVGSRGPEAPQTDKARR